MQVQSTRRLTLHHRRRFAKFQFTPKFITILITSIIALFLITTVAVAFVTRDLPAPGKVAVIEGSATEFLDRNGKVIFQTYKDKNRIPVEINEVAKSMKEATIAVEDADFYKHQGYSIRGIFGGLSREFLEEDLPEAQH